MIEQYFGISLKKLACFASLVFSAAVVTTFVFGMIFGFDKWLQDMNVAKNLMLAGATVSVAQPPVATGGGWGGADAGGAGQFLCPQHGAVGMPVVDPMGSPHCPVCGQGMLFHGTGMQNTPHHAAGLGGGAGIRF